MTEETTLNNQCNLLHIPLYNYSYSYQNMNSCNLFHMYYHNAQDKHHDNYPNMTRNKNQYSQKNSL